MIKLYKGGFFQKKLVLTKLRGKINYGIKKGDNVENVKNTTSGSITITEEEIQQNRLRIREIGRNLCGTRMICVKSENVDLKYKDNAKNGLNQLRRPIKKYFIESVDVLSVSTIKSPDGEIQVQINNDPELKVSLRSEKNRFMDATTEQEVLGAMDEFDTKGTIRFFTDYELVKKIVVAENKRHEDYLNELAESFMNQASVLKSINTIEDANYAAYMKSLEQ